MFFSRKEGSREPGFVVSPRLAGIIVVICVMAVPGVPVGYLVPVAIFLGGVAVFRLEGRKYRQEREQLHGPGRRSEDAGRIL